MWFHQGDSWIYYWNNVRTIIIGNSDKQQSMILSFNKSLPQLSLSNRKVQFLSTIQQLPKRFSLLSSRKMNYHPLFNYRFISSFKSIITALIVFAPILLLFNNFVFASADDSNWSLNLNLSQLIIKNPQSHNDVENGASTYDHYNHQNRITLISDEDVLEYEQLQSPTLRRKRRQSSSSYQSELPPNITLGYGQHQQDQGPWGPWTDLSECSKSCGGGIYYQTRVCLDPRRSCIGPTKRYFSCNIQECPKGTKDFRSNQCERFNPIPFDGRYYNWQPHYKAGGNPCELNCKPENERFYYRHSRKVIDGTRCYDDDSNNICVDGVCVELGCDRVLGSMVKEDNCRVCGGDGSTCRKVSGVYQQNQGLRTGYNDMLYIPAGSTNIQIQEVLPTNNYLAIRNQKGKSYLNGKWRIQPPSTYDIAGSKFHYERPHGNRQYMNFSEKLRALGPITEPLFIQLLYQEANHGISYEYSIPLSEDQPGGEDYGQLPPAGHVNQRKGYPRYVWIFGDYSKCSKTCGTGIQRRNVYCASMNPKTGQQEPTSDSLCDSSKRPPDTRPCHNEQKCSAQWQHSGWSECSCVHRVRFRNVYCSNGDSVTCQAEESSLVIVPDSQCSENNQTKPESVQKCEPDFKKCPQWIVEDWKKCDSHCGVGKQTRMVRCVLWLNKLSLAKAGTFTTIPTSELSTNTESVTDSTLISTNPAEPSKIPTTISTKDEVSDTNLAPTTATTIIPADQVLQPAKREVEDEEMKYVEDYLCDPEKKPAEEQSCSLKPCEDLGLVEWVVSPWSSCDTDCGSQVQTRQVACVSRDGQVFPDETCVKFRGERPADSQDCLDGTVCSKSLWFTSEWSKCSGTTDAEGIQTRHVFCGHVDDKGMVIKDDIDKCQMQTEPSKTAVCEQEENLYEKSQWFTAPSGPCTVPCGGGQKMRKHFCLMNSKKNGSSTVELTISDQCKEMNEDLISSMSISEQCNVEACDADQLASIVDCKDSEFGCCPSDGSTPAEKDFHNCPLISIESKEECLKAEFGCCLTDNSNSDQSDTGNLTLALGPFGLGCPVRCANSKFGCCPDMITLANSTDLSECPIIFEETTMTTTTMEPSTTTMMPATTELLATTMEIPLIALSFSNCSEGDIACQMSTTHASEIIKDCSKSKFGCCPDGWNEAQGPDSKGCEESSGDISSFISSTIATVMNMFITDSEVSTGDSLDCSLTQFGCCPNGKTKATGPRYYGCTCHDYPFGCCQDGFSPASGENLEGCLCERMLYGCCADGRTPATGPNQEGCDCTSSPYSCCSDMFTFAKGPNYQGCPCDTLTFGCCPDSQIPARGPDFAGCSCADTPFGCCADGVTVAYGPKFEGCPSGLPLDTKLNSEVCKLPMEPGPCSNFSVQWFFDNENGRCNRFWYGGCQGNGNRFSSQEQCERSCVKPEGPERCLLPKITGPCNSSSEAYYYDGETKRCERFLYGGCLGNTNRFETMDQCVQTCIYQETALDQCDQPVQAGPCLGNYSRWYYRREEGRCREFSYGGCQGNLNNFQTEDECQNACASRSPFEICMLPKAQGSCLGSFPRWYFDSNSGKCQEFTYSGCGGNKNRFVDRVSCEQLCNQTIPEHFYPIYGNDTGLRHPHPYQPPIQDNEILPVVPPSSYESVCALPQAHGPCRETIIQWYFDVRTRRCERFYYGGCGGNDNRFNDREQCEQKCLAYASQITPMLQQDPCLEPKDSGDAQCQDYRHRWYYDVEDRLCHRFYYYGCGGNRNNFESDEECTARCVWPRERGSQHQTSQGGQIQSGSGGHSTHLDSDHSMTSIEEFQQEHCFKQYDSGPCEKNHIQWHYDSRDGVCKEFIYGGCGGNENRFHSQQECQTKCWNSQDICRLSPVRGSCSANFTQWYYDHQNNECYEFQFSGCYGNANRFSSKDTCEQQCKSKVSSIIEHTPDQQQLPSTSSTMGGSTYSEQCRLPRDPGPCRGYFQQYYFSAEENQCQVFIYGGCGGNENRFKRLEECEQTCLHQNAHIGSAADEEPREGVDLPETVCFLKMESGPCKETQARWWYDPDSHTCFPFVYGGCRGNKNRFPDFDQCIRFCSRVSRSFQFSPSPSIPLTSEAPNQQAYPYVPLSVSQSDHSRHGSCVPMECHEENCILGIDYYRDERGCPACRCINPCNDIRCSDDMSCSVELFRDEISGKIRANAECRLRIKPGQCPTNIHQIPESEREQSPECFDQCRSDADCRNSDKCCHNGCANICVAPEGSSSQEEQQAGYNNQTYYYSSSPSTPSQQHPNYYNYSVDDQNGGPRNHGQPPYAEGSSYATSQQSYFQQHSDYSNSYGQPYPTNSSYQNQRQQNVYSHSSSYDSNGQHSSIGSGHGHSNQIVYPSNQHIYYTMDQQKNNSMPQQQHQSNYPYLIHPYNLHQQQHGQRQDHRQPIEEDSYIVDDGYNSGRFPHSDQDNNKMSNEIQVDHYQPSMQSHHVSNQYYLKQSGQQHHYQYPDRQEHQQHLDKNQEMMFHNNQQQQHSSVVIAQSDQDEVILGCPTMAKDNGNSKDKPQQPVVWIKDDQQIDQSLDRYKILSNGSLRILNIEPNDRGIYYCLSNPQIGYGSVSLEINEPSRILPDGPKKVIAQIGMPAYLHCNFIGTPEPKVTWWRGDQLLPINDRKYQQMPNHTLLIQKVDDKDSGLYTCHVFNGIGHEHGERKDIELLLDNTNSKRDDEFEIVPYDPNLFRNSDSQNNARHNDINHGNNQMNITPNNANNYSVDQDPITIEIDFWPKDYRVGTLLHLDCFVRNQRTGQIVPSANVVWYINSDIPLLVDQTNRHHYMLMPNNSLLVYHLTRSDSGEYRCRAGIGPQSDTYSSVHLQVENIHIPSDCQDNPIFANCAMIIQNNYCRNPHYHKFCCRSCYIVEHGQQQQEQQLSSMMYNQNRIQQKRKGQSQ